jgi:molybdopterin biosynthesis enzyme
MGSHDLIKPYLNEKGKIIFGRLNMKPGKPTTFARFKNALVFGLPGNPTSAFVTAKLFIPLALSTMQS